MERLLMSKVRCGMDNLHQKQHPSLSLNLISDIHVQIRGKYCK